MRIRLRRRSNDRHSLVVERADGSRLACELETRSVLLHDLVHFALESEAGLADGFWGRLAAGDSFATLRDEAAAPTDSEIWLVEKLVGPFQAVWKGQLSAEQYVGMVGGRAPFVDVAFVAAVRERLRRLWGEWQGTPFHEEMVLEWDGRDPR